MARVSDIWIAENCLTIMYQLAEEQYPLETGGMLIGYIAATGEPVVTSIIGPGPNAKHRRYKFTPDGSYQQAMLEAHFHSTEGRETYLGDWHTHPKLEPTPSYLDKCTLAKIAKEPRSKILQPVMVILGGCAGKWRLNAIRYLSSERKLLFKIHHITVLTLNTYSSTQKI